MSLGGIFVEELQNWSNYFVVDSVVNRYEIPFPTKTKESNQTHHDKSFIRLLFDDNWNETFYYREFELNPDYREWPSQIRNRLMVYPGCQYFHCVSDSTSTQNIFFLNYDIDIPLLDTLMYWRNDSTSVILVDSTAIVNPEIVYLLNDTYELHVNYDSLTPLSKLIYCFLDLQIYQNYTHLLLSEPIATNILEYFYELYVNDKLFKYLSSLGWEP